MSLVTVIIASYNHSAYIGKSIASVVKQTYKPVQIIVIDDCSSDDSANIISELRKKYDFLFLQNDTNLGLNTSIIKALQYAEGDYIGLLASDDYIHPDKLFLQVNYLVEKNKDAVYSNGFEVRDSNILPINLNNFNKAYQKNKGYKYLCQYDFGAPLLQSGLFKKEVFADSIAIRKEFKSDDWAFAIKVFRDFNTGFLNQPLFYYRIHPTNTHKNYWITFPMRIDVVSRLIPDVFKTRALSNIFLSQGTYLLQDNRYLSAFRFFAAAMFMNFSISSAILMMKSIAFKIVKRNRK